MNADSHKGGWAKTHCVMLLITDGLSLETHEFPNLSATAVDKSFHFSLLHEKSQHDRDAFPAQVQRHVHAEELRVQNVPVMQRRGAR